MLSPSVPCPALKTTWHGRGTASLMQAGPNTLQTLGGSRLVMMTMAGLETQGIRFTFIPTTSTYLSTCKFTVRAFAVAIAPCVVNANLMRAFQDKIALTSSLAETGTALALAQYQ
eukprot:symbB.v1.2.006927.t1/scaffold400.1/size211454/6